MYGGCTLATSTSSVRAVFGHGSIKPEQATASLFSMHFLHLHCSTLHFTMLQSSKCVHATLLYSADTIRCYYLGAGRPRGLLSATKHRGSSDRAALAAERVVSSHAASKQLPSSPAYRPRAPTSGSCSGAHCATPLRCGGTSQLLDIWSCCRHAGASVCDAASPHITFWGHSPSRVKPRASSSRPLLHPPTHSSTWQFLRASVQFYSNALFSFSVEPVMHIAGDVSHRNWFLHRR